VTVYVDFESIGRRGECPPGQSLLDCARQLGVELGNFCGGAGSCGRCIVQVLDGEASEPAAVEGEYLCSEQLAKGAMRTGIDVLLETGGLSALCQEVRPGDVPGAGRQVKSRPIPWSPV
jgi:uncharacterized 2Fe-2S/4Fe-4S cluster protein (DUF4445 family)